jgi:hypothetical protein
MKWTPSLAVTLRSSASLSVLLAVGLQVITDLPKSHHDLLLIVLVTRVGAVSFVTAASRENVSRHCGIIMHGLLPHALKIGVTESTALLNISGGVTITFPPRWNLPLLLKGNEEVPSNCSYLTEQIEHKGCGVRSFGTDFSYQLFAGCNSTRCCFVNEVEIRTGKMGQTVPQIAGTH